MGIVWKILLAISTVLLCHSGFSSHEFHQLIKNATQNVSSSTLRHIPDDIKYEAIAGLLLFVLSMFLSFEKLSYYPLQGNRELLKCDQFLHDIEMSKANYTNNLTGRDPFGVVTYTPNFVDIHAKRRQVKESLSEINEDGSTKR